MSGAQTRLRILMSAAARAAIAAQVSEVMGGQPFELLCAEELKPGADFDIAFVSRDVTATSSKTELLPHTQHFHDLLRRAPGLQWVHIHASGNDRPVYLELLSRGVAVHTSSGANAEVVAHSALAGLLSLARRLPQMMAAQRAHRWAPLIAGTLPRDLPGQQALIVGWGPVGQHIGRLLQVLGLQCTAVRRAAHAAGPEGVPAIALADLDAHLADADWLILACPLTAQTEGLIDAARLRRLPAHAHLINVARGEVVVEPDLIEALRAGRLAGAHLDVFAHEPLAADSPLWDLPQVIVTPHAAGHSDGNAQRVAALFLQRLQRWRADRHG